MKVKLKKLWLENFKGIKELEVNFSDKTVISGKNGSGKSSIFDAFTWLLFGKNSADKKVFNIKTLDSEGKEIPNLDHAVTAIIECDGVDIKFKRVLTEKWVRKRGEAEAKFAGNTEVFEIDDVEVKGSDYNAKISVICSESIFKSITSPYFFTAQKWEEQRKQLLDLVRNVEIEYSDEFKAIINTLAEKQKTVEQARKEIQSIKKNISAEISTIPAKIEILQKNLSEYNGINFENEEKDLQDAKSKLAKIEAETEVSINIEKNAEILAISNQIAENEIKITEIEGKLKSGALRSYNDAENAKIAFDDKITKLRNNINSLNAEIRSYEAHIKSVSERKNHLIEDWKMEKAIELSFSEDDFKCPTCGRGFDLDKIEEIRENAIASFNADKAAKLKSIEEEGSEINDDIEVSQKVIDANKHSIELHENEIKELLSQTQPTLPEHPNNLDFSNDPEIVKLTEETDALRKVLAMKQANNSAPAEIINHDEEKAELQKIIENKVAIISKKSVAEHLRKQISEQESDLREKSQKLAEIEGKEYQLSELIKFRINALESAINAKFEYVKFKLFKQQVNGEEVECCEATVNGVPYSDVNTAGKINAGLDIIRTICTEYHTYAPIFIDNAESVNEIIATDSQQIHLVVTNDSLTINNI